MTRPPHPVPPGRPRPWPAAAAALLALAALLPGPSHAGKAHQHGVAALDVVVDGPTLTLSLDTPLDNLLGFERAPRTDAERRRVQALSERLRAPAGLIRPDAAAGCTPGETTIEAPVVGLGGSATAAKDDHADLSATFSFRCASPDALRSVDLAGLFGAWTGLKRLQVQVAGPAGQRQRTLTPATPRLDLR